MLYTTSIGLVFYQRWYLKVSIKLFNLFLCMCINKVFITVEFPLLVQYYIEVW